MNNTSLTTHEFLTIKEAAKRFCRSEQTIRRLVKQHALTSHVRTEKTAKGNTYLVSQQFLTEQYPPVLAAAQLPESDMLEPQLPAVVVPDQVEEIVRLQAALAERDQTIQKLQHRLLEQNDVLNALTSQVNSQRIGHIEELILRQNEQLGELQKRLPEPSEGPQGEVVSEQPKKTFWQRIFGK
ncbi:helix-turn-helix transcriptional regulator [Hymenobacter profundi]|uniref:DNA-binding protein n=1 Tax=Hymenobacter profundi TaxID=1982110 RepID=A0ABS6X617_9BACT|nr:DNA-binding protein [Hymenobacter profundi]MBW3130766.1 DNA-binding protein [Hymenobacter profundi]